MGVQFLHALAALVNTASQPRLVERGVQFLEQGPDWAIKLVSDEQVQYLARLHLVLDALLI
jgi:hypothetical protein